jgi:hypothetical protein
VTGGVLIRTFPSSMSAPNLEGDLTRHEGGTAELDTIVAEKVVVLEQRSG